MPTPRTIPRKVRRSRRRHNGTPAERAARQAARLDRNRVKGRQLVAKTATRRVERGERHEEMLRWRRLSGRWRFGR